MSSQRPSFVECLEGRQLLADPLLRVGAVAADNRGTVVIRLSERAVGVRGGAAQMYTAGSDGKLFTSDDAKVNARVTYSENKKEITLRGNLAKNTVYRVKLDGKTRIRSEASNQLLDGDFSGKLASGNGKAGGNFEFVSSVDTSSTPEVRLDTSVGVMRLKMRKDVAPISAGKFIDLADSSKYDGIFVYRSIPGFVLQAGALQVTGDGQQASDVVLNTATEFGEESRVLSNTRGTLSFARNSLGNGSIEFFFNVENNNGNNPNPGFSNNLDEGEGTPPSRDPVFTPFAQVLGADGLAVMDAIEGKPIADLRDELDPQRAAAVAVNNKAQAEAGVVPIRDIVIIKRTAVLMKIGKKP